MKKIIHTDHLSLRLKVRKIPEDYPKKIYLTPDQKYYDVFEKTFIYIKKLRYSGKIRNMMIACEEMAGEVRIITIHPITEENVINRVIRGRWIKHEREI
jgi:hypothetical protein